MASALNHRYPAIQGELEDEFEDEYEMEDEFEDEGELEGEFEFEFEAEAELEDESEDEDEDESEAFVNPVRRIYRDAELMAHLSSRASESESEEESEAFLGALIPIAARLIPRAAGLITRNAPALIRGATQIGRRLMRDPGTRRLVKAMPVVLQRTAQSLADQAGNGTDIDPDVALRTLATMTDRVLGSPAASRRAVRAVSVFDQRYRRRAARPGVGLPGGPAYSRYPARYRSASARRRPAMRQAAAQRGVRRGRRLR